jgi:outer membrane protein assembly factor BamB
MEPSQRRTQRTPGAAVPSLLAALLLLMAPGAAPGQRHRAPVPARADWAGVLPREFFRPGAADPRAGIIGTIIDVPPARPAPGPAGNRQPVQMRVRVIRAPSGPPDGGEAGILIQADRRLVQALRHAQDLIVDEAWVDACRQLQAILEAPEDGFFHPDPEERKLHRSLKAETLRIIGALPAAGRGVYRNQFAPAADVLLAEAARTDDFNKLAEVARLYFHTPAGHEAVYRLGLRHLDRNEPLAAALFFERVRQVPELAGRWEPLLSLRTALCWHRTGMPEAARAIVLELAAKHDPAALRLGGEPLPAFDPAGDTQQWLARAFGSEGQASVAGRHEWGVFRGDPARSAVTARTEPATDAEPWEAETIIPIADAFEPTDSRLHEALRTAVEAQRRGYDNRGSPVLPRLAPLIVGERIVARTAGNVVALDRRTGERRQEMLEDDGYAGLIEQWEHGGLANESGVLSQVVNQRIWIDATYGGLSSDGRLAFAAEESGIAGIPAAPSVHTGLAPRESNLLRAYDVDSGHIVWERGGQSDEFALPLAGAFFLGAPLPLAGRLFAIAEQHGEVRLLALHPANGALDWEQPLAGTSISILVDHRRRTSGVSPSYADGVLVCPTGTGSVVALDLMTRSLLWAYQAGDPAPQVVHERLRGRRGIQVIPQAAVRKGGWLDDVAVIARRHVLLTPGDSDELHCLDLLDGTLRWKQPRGDALYVAGVVDDQVLVVGAERIIALRLANGTPAWPEPAKLDDDAPANVSGRGFILDGRLYVPLSTSEIAIIDAGTGRLLGRAATPEGHVPGNLICARGLIVSQNAESVAAFPLPVLEENVADASPRP